MPENVIDMTYKEFKEYCNKRTYDGRWNFFESIECLNLINDIESIKAKGLFKKRKTERLQEKRWQEIKNERLY